MRAADMFAAKVMPLEEAVRTVARWRLQGRTVVFTNGCFDILHAGHLDLLERASTLGDRLVLGLNSDASIRRLKGEERPVNDERFRARMLAAMSVVDAVVVFAEDTPLAVIESLKPDILVKGGDYRAEDVVGAGVVAAHGGRVEIVPLTDGHSTTGLIGRIRRL